VCDNSELFIHAVIMYSFDFTPHLYVNVMFVSCKTPSWSYLFNLYLFLLNAPIKCTRHTSTVILHTSIISECAFNTRFASLPHDYYIMQIQYTAFLVRVIGNAEHVWTIAPEMESAGWQLACRKGRDITLKPKDKKSTCSRHPLPLSTY
jgi:hypothetical protein